MKRKIGLLFVTLMTSLLALVNVKVEAKPEVSPAPQTLEVKDVLEEGAIEGSGRVVRRVASPAANHKASQAYMQVTVPTADGKVNVRFVAGIDSAEYAEAQLKLEMFDGNTSKGSYAAKVTTAYTAMVIPGAEEPQTAAQVFGEGYNYIVAYTMKNMPRESWENGFKASVGLKLAGEETFTETAAEEVKNVKAAIMADNHLVFSWKPWGDHVDTGSVIWENDFVINDLAPEINREDYEEDSAHNAMFKDIINAKMRAEATMENGDVYYSSNVAIHNCQAKDGKHVSVKFANLNGIDLRDSLYTIKFYIELSDGTEVVGAKDFTRLDPVTNAVIELNENSEHVLTFDAPKGAETFTYRLFNDSYSAIEKSVNSGDVIDVSTLPVGVFNIEITAHSQYYVSSSTTFAEILNIETAITILDGNEAFKFELHHEGTNYEHVFRFKPVDSANAVTANNMVKELTVIREKDGFVTNVGYVKKTLANGIGAINAYPYFDENTGYYTFGFSIGETPYKSNVYNIKFIIEADNGKLFKVDLQFISDDTTTGVGETIIDVYKDIFRKNYESLELTSDLYTDENWTAVQNIYNETLISLDNASSSAEILENIINTAMTKIRNIEKKIAIIDAYKHFDLEVWHREGNWEYIIRFKPIDPITNSITADDMITELLGWRASGKQFNISYATRTVGDIVVDSKTPSYNKDTGYYTFAVSFGHFAKNEKEEVYFIAETDAGQKYAFHFYVTVTTNDPAKAKVEFVSEQFDVEENFGLLKKVYSEENWNQILEIYENYNLELKKGINTLNKEKLQHLQGYIDEANAVEMDAIAAIDASIKKTWIVTSHDDPNKTLTGLTNGDYADTCYVSYTNNSYYLIELDQAYDLLAVYLKWEGANAAEYTIEVSEDGVNYREVASFSETPTNHNREETLTLADAYNIKYVKILMKVPVNSAWGYKAREIDLFIAK